MAAESYKIEGEVEAVRKDRRGLLVNDNWYSSYYQPEGINDVGKGDRVIFNAKTNDKGFHNITSKIVKSSGDDEGEDEEESSGGGGASNSGGKSYSPSGNKSGSGQARQGGFPIEPSDSQRAIIRQNALTNSCNLAGTIGLVDDSMTPQEVADAVIPIAERFEEYTTGDRDKRIAKEMLEEKNNKGDKSSSSSSKDASSTSRNKKQGSTNKSEEDARKTQGSNSSRTKKATEEKGHKEKDEGTEDSKGEESSEGSDGDDLDPSEFLDD